MRFLNDVQFVNFANKKELKSRPVSFDVKLLVDEILNQTNAIFYQSGRIIANINTSGQFFCSDKVLLSRIVTCLLDNAFKFSAKEVLLTVASSREQLVIEVKDQGYGIPNDQLGLIFTPFFRCDNVKMISGTGLGLSIVKGAVECLNGNIFIDSIVLKGTRVKLIIPSDGC
jgi:K+-sensing histidine kinase KdpD